jgi:hypothetical protein
MTKIRKGQAPAPLSRIQFHDRFTEPFQDPLFAPEEASLARVEDVAWKAYRDSRKAPVTHKAGKGYAEEVRNVARAVVNAVREARAGRFSAPDAKLDSPRPK